MLVDSVLTVSLPSKTRWKSTRKLRFYKKKGQKFLSSPVSRLLFTARILQRHSAIHVDSLSSSIQKKETGISSGTTFLSSSFVTLWSSRIWFIHLNQIHARIFKILTVTGTSWHFVRNRRTCSCISLRMKAFLQATVKCVVLPSIHSNGWTLMAIRFMSNYAGYRKLAFTISQQKKQQRFKEKTLTTLQTIRSKRLKTEIIRNGICSYRCSIRLTSISSISIRSTQQKIGLKMSSHSNTSVRWHWTKTSTTILLKQNLSASTQVSWFQGCCHLKISCYKVVCSLTRTHNATVSERTTNNFRSTVRSHKWTTTNVMVQCQSVNKRVR